MAVMIKDIFLWRQIICNCMLSTYHIDPFGADEYGLLTHNLYRIICGYRATIGDLFPITIKHELSLDKYWRTFGRKRFLSCHIRPYLSRDIHVIIICYRLIAKCKIETKGISVVCRD